MSKKTDLSLAGQTLKYKLRIGFLLVVVLPFLVSFYIVLSYLVPSSGLSSEIKVLITGVFITLIISLLGFWVIREIFNRINAITTHAKMLASGNIDKLLEVETDDEVGVLCGALNNITRNIRGHMDELKQYSEKTTQIHIEIQKRVMVISSLMQISSLASQGAKLEDILKLTIEKARLLADSDAGYLLLREDLKDGFYMKIADGINTQLLNMFRIEPHDELLNKVIKIKKELWVDKKHPWPQGIKSEFQQKLNLRNTIAVPVYMKNKLMGILGIGNLRDDFAYKGDEIELLDIFSKQIAIVMENDLLMHKVEKLEIKDDLTGLYNKIYIVDRLEEEIRRSINYQRPCSFVIFNIDDFHKYSNEFGSLGAESVLKKTALIIRDSIREIDRVGRFDDDEFAVILPENNKRQAHQLAESIRRKIEANFIHENKKITVSGAVSENPLDGVSADELIVKAKQLLSVAKKEGKNRVLGA